MEWSQEQPQALELAQIVGRVPEGILIFPCACNSKKTEQGWLLGCNSHLGSGSSNLSLQFAKEMHNQRIMGGDVSFLC